MCFFAHGSNDQHNRSYKIKVTKIGHTITTTERHVKTTLIMAEDNLRNEISGTN